MRLPVNQFLSLIPIAMLAACSPGHGKLAHGSAPTPTPAHNGPAADYPMLIGEPYELGGQTWRPEDKLNYDAVGRAAFASGEMPDGGAIALAHRTLPVPSYVEVTSLDSGRTILARITRRGPASADRLVELSPAAAEQIGLSQDGAPVRVRRVNPPEPERALLRAGQRAPLRMDTPKSLVSVLLRRLDAGAPAAAPALPMLPAVTSVQPVPVTKPAPPPASAVGAASGGLFVQVAAFASKANADRAAASVNGKVEPAGKLFHVRAGPFAGPVEAGAALAKVRAAGYRDARIVGMRH